MLFNKVWLMFWIRVADIKIKYITYLKYIMCGQMGSEYHAHILSIWSTLEQKLLGFQLQQIQTALRGQNQLIIFPTSQQFQKGGDIMKRSLPSKVQIHALGKKDEGVEEANHHLHTYLPYLSPPP